jgi:hypothetical protein
VNQATFQFSRGQFMRLSMEIVGQDETIGASGSFPSYTIVPNTAYTIFDAVLTLLTYARGFEQCSVTIANNLIRDRYLNSNTLTDIPLGPRQTTLSVNLPYTEIDLYKQAMSGDAAATLVVTNGSATGNGTTTFTFATLQTPAESPNVGSREGEIMLTLNSIARGTISGSTITPELSITHVVH